MSRINQVDGPLNQIVVRQVDGAHLGLNWAETPLNAA